MRIRLESCSFAYGELPVFDGLDLDFPESRITAILGPSGCGKTSLLRIAAGLARPSAGRLVREGAGRIAMVFQEDRLLPWRSVRRNLEFALAPGTPKEGLGGMVAAALGSVGLADFADARPDQLSGGMRQRVAIARAFGKPSGLLLMDEAFRSLDLRMRNELGELFLSLWERDRPTSIVVTHDLDEAISLAHRIIVLSSRPARVVLDLKLEGEPGAARSGSGEAAEAEKMLRKALLEA